MALLIDPPRWIAHGRRWSHLASDTSFAELHAFAAALGLDGRGFEGDHYDVPEERYAQALAAGAYPVESRELVARLRACGLRRRKRRGEKVLAGLPGPGGSRVDTVLSRLAPTVPVVGHILLLHRVDHVLVVPAAHGVDLPRSALPPPDGDQLGYLRHVDVALEATRSAQVVWVVRVRAGQAAPAAVPERAQWMPDDRAAQLLAPTLAPLLRRLDLGASRWPA